MEVSTARNSILEFKIIDEKKILSDEKFLIKRNP